MQIFATMEKGILVPDEVVIDLWPKQWPRRAPGSLLTDSLQPLNRRNWLRRQWAVR